jgi:hypothetical protein
MILKYKIDDLMTGTVFAFHCDFTSFVKILSRT